jgi:hypothetical protein
MKITAGTNLSNVNSVDELKRFTGIFASEVAQILNANILFADNFTSKVLSFVFPSANKTIGMNHGLGVIPGGYILIGANVALSLFDGVQKNTVDIIYLQSNAAGTAKVLVFA